MTARLVYWGCGACGARNPPADACMACGAPSGAQAPPRLTVSDAGHLRLAARWGLLRSQAGRVFLLGGGFSMRVEDMADLLVSAGAHSVHQVPDLAWLAMKRAPRTEAVLVAGWPPPPGHVAWAEDASALVLDEEALVLELVPRLAHLLAAPGEPPF